MSAASKKTLIMVGLGSGLAFQHPKVALSPVLEWRCWNGGAGMAVLEWRCWNGGAGMAVLTEVGWPARPARIQLVVSRRT
ncbi:MAG: hypothetical protein OXC63_09675 [Aestuariivita sp.]|nr:hypothetical protein [Aestuariivita sp.]